MKHVEEFKEVLLETYYLDVYSDPHRLIDLIAENMALEKCIIDGGTPVELIEKCKNSPLTKRLKETKLW